VLALDIHENEIFNLGTNKGCTVIELVDLFKEVTGKDLRVIEEQPRSGDVAVMFADSEHAHAKLQWKPTKAVRDMVQSTVSLYGI
jgi:UDP-glucose 4-epimerase